jgi:hypothetical protein
MQIAKSNAKLRKLRPSFNCLNIFGLVFRFPRLQTHLYWSLHVWLRVPEVEQPRERDQNEHGLYERGVVDQGVNVAHAEVKQAESALRIFRTNC